MGNFEISAILQLFTGLSIKKCVKIKSNKKQTIPVLQSCAKSRNYRQQSNNFKRYQVEY